MPFYDRGTNHIYYEEVGSGFPLLIIPGWWPQFLHSVIGQVVSLQPHADLQG